MNQVLVILGVFLLALLLHLFVLQKEGFANAPPSPYEGQSIKCRDNKTYRVMNGVIRVYPTPEIAASWDPNWASAPRINTCSQIPGGSPMAMKPPTPAIPASAPAPAPTLSTLPTQPSTPAASATQASTPLQKYEDYILNYYYPTLARFQGLLEFTKDQGPLATTINQELSMESVIRAKPPTQNPATQKIPIETLTAMTKTLVDDINAKMRAENLGPMLVAFDVTKPTPQVPRSVGTPQDGQVPVAMQQPTAPSPKPASVATTTTTTTTAPTTTKPQPQPIASTAPTVSPQAAGYQFSELVNSLISFSPQSQAKLTSTPYTVPGAKPDSAIAAGSNVGGSNFFDQIRTTVRDEIKTQLADVKKGPKDTVNDKLADRATGILGSTAAKVKSDALQQGSWFRQDTTCPYAQGQQASSIQPPIDMNDYVRKDSIPCWNCTLK